MCLRGLVWLIPALVLAGVAGCGGKAGELEKKALELEKVFAATTAQPNASAGQGHASAAAAAIKAGDYPKAMLELSALQTQAGLTPEQRMTVNAVAGDVVPVLVKSAANGDAQAKAALERLKQERDRR
jgi:hypothetical protein